MREILIIELKKRIFSDNHFEVYSAKLPGAKFGRVIYRGNIKTAIRAHQWVACGEWHDHPRWGAEFIADRLSPYTPCSWSESAELERVYQARQALGEVA